jgi:hypothetical protein
VKPIADITVDTLKYKEIVKELKELKRIKYELTTKIKNEDNSRKMLEKRKDKEIQKLNNNL